MKRIQSLIVFLTVLTGAGIWLWAPLDQVSRVGHAASVQNSKYAVHSGTVEMELEAADDPTQMPTELRVDDGSMEAGLGLNQGGTIWFVNRLQPPSYPATLTQMLVFFRTVDGLMQGAPITLLVGSNLDGNADIDGTAFQQINTTIQSLGQFNTYAVPAFTINSGDFVVGFRMQISAGMFPGALDTNSQRNRRSYVSTTGFDFDLIDDLGGGVPPGNLGIRALVTVQPPILSVTPTALTFNVMAGQTQPQSQTFMVSNTGTGTFNYTITTSDSNLATTSPTAGTLGAGGINTITVFVVPPGTPGTRQAFLTVTAPGAQNSPQIVTVTVNTISPPAVLNVTPTSLVFDASVGQGNPPPQSFMVRNTGSGFLNYSIASNSGSVTASPTTGTLGSGQSQSIQVSASNPNTPGIITAQLTVTAPGAQNSPQVVSVTIQTQVSELNESEPNNRPQEATSLFVPFPGRSLTVNGDARPNDTGTGIDQVDVECMRDRSIQDWYRLVVTQRDAFRTVLDFDRNAADFDLFVFIQTNDFAQFPDGVQLIATSLQGPGQAEIFSSRVLEPGTYFIGVSRVRRNNLSDFQRISYTLTLTRSSSPELHVIEDVTCIAFVDPDPTRNGAYVVNRVRPTSYPARLEAISILFGAPPGQPSPEGRPVRIIAFTDPAGSGTPPFNPSLVVNQMVTVAAANQFNQLNLGAGGPVVNSGDFYVGYVIDTPNRIHLNLGRVIYPNIRSFISTSFGQSYQPFFYQDMQGRPFNLAIRPTVNTRPFGKTDDPEFHSTGDSMEMTRPRIIQIR